MTISPNPVTTPRHGLPPEARRNRSNAPAAFICKKAKIDERLARLQALSDDPVNAHPDEINWGHVGTLEHYAVRRSGSATGASSLACTRLLLTLRRLTDSAFGEGEHLE